jgi:hypothetical protein
MAAWPETPKPLGELKPSSRSEENGMTPNNVLKPTAVNPTAEQRRCLRGGPLRGPSAGY